MQFAVPQFTDVEDKLIGPLTLKQFLVLVAAGGLCLLFWSLPISKVVSVLIDIPIALIGIGLAFMTYNGRPALTYIFPFVSYLISPKLMIFRRETNTAEINKVEPIKKVETPKVVEVEETADSRLKKLAYLLDQKTAQQQDLINQTINNNLQQAQETAADKESAYVPHANTNFMEFSKAPTPEPQVSHVVSDNIEKIKKMAAGVDLSVMNFGKANSSKTAKKETPKPSNVQISHAQKSILDD